MPAQFRRTDPILRISFAAAVIVVATLAAAQPPETSRPNVVLIVTDDQGYGDASSYGSTDLQTPNLDRLGREGVRFTQFRVNPLCAPTRASLLTGLDSLATGMWRGPSEPARAAAKAKKRGKVTPDEDPDDAAEAGTVRRLHDDLILLPQFLQRAGYATGAFGKWHLGYEARNQPNARGFDEFVGFLGGAHPYWLRANSRLLENGKPLVIEGHTTDVFADRAIAFIRANRARPFFCYLPFNAVHGPMRSADRAADSGKPDWLAHYERRGVPPLRRDYNAVMSHADERIGDVLATLSELGLADRTLVICHSDNGGILHTYPSNNGPLRGGKGQTYEGGIRVPAFMRWPGVIPAGTVSTADAAHYDVFATVLEAAGLPVPERNGRFPVRGVSLLAHVRSAGRTPLPDRYQFWDLYGQCGALHGRWKLVGVIGNHHGRFDQAAREAEQTRFALYDLETDLAEKHDRAAEFPAIYTDLKDRHLAWLRQFVP
ncbi:MAG: sulfatase-like hydrolase/transferase [Verrucomicrobia bacterium]|nr:sulfatase-like hydrolase/transferase [Verrucomicrobiota bacterium]